MRSIFFASAFADPAKAMLPAKDQVSLSIDFMSTPKRDEGAASSEISDAYFGEMFKVE